jgi:hypothetical protein
LIVTEGSVTEVIYFKRLRELLRLSRDLVEVTPGKGTGPENLVKDAIRLRDTRNREARKQNSNLVFFEEVWCVLDSEGVHREQGLRTALDLARKEKIQLALSRPCFEFWLLLHVQYSSSDFANCDAAAAFLAQKLPEYRKNSPPMELLSGLLPAAVQNAERLRADHKRTGSISPGTDVDVLVRTLNGVTRPQNQLPLEPCP